MVKKAEIAKFLKITPTRAAQLVKEGCPQTSLKAVKAWREANPPKRPPVNNKQSPRVNPRAAEKTRNAATDPVGRSNPPPKAPKPLPVPVLVKSGDSLLDALNGAILASDFALDRFLDASANHSVTAGVRLSEYSRALAVRFTAEETYRKEQERRNVLADKGKIMQVCRMALEAVKRRAQRIPIEVGPQCNPENPLLGTKVLEREMAGLMKVAAREIDGLIITRKV